MDVSKMSSSSQDIQAHPPVGKKTKKKSKNRKPEMKEKKKKSICIPSRPANAKSSFLLHLPAVRSFGQPTGRLKKYPLKPFVVSHIPREKDERRPLNCLFSPSSPQIAVKDQRREKKEDPCSSGRP